MNVAADMTVGVRFSASMVMLTTSLDTFKGALATCCIDGSQHVYTITYTRSEIAHTACHMHTYSLVTWLINNLRLCSLFNFKCSCSIAWQTLEVMQAHPLTTKVKISCLPHIPLSIWQKSYKHSLMNVTVMRVCMYVHAYTHISG